MEMIVSASKGWEWSGFLLEQLVKCSELSISVGKKIREIIKQTIEGGQ